MIARFEEFEIDTTQCRLSRQGKPIPLAKQPLDLLILLVQRPGELVTREEIATALWGISTFVDSEHGINNAIKKIRGALGDDSANPRCIETVVRRGYRFKPSPVLVEELVPAGASSVNGHVHFANDVSAPIGIDVGASVGSPVREVRGKRWHLAWVAAGITLAAMSLFAVGEMRTVPGPRLRWTPLTRATRVHTNLPLSSDGRFVYWTEYDEHGCRPMRVPLKGGDPGPVKMPFTDAFVLDANADGHLLLNVREFCKNMDVEGAVWELDSETAEPRRVGDLTAQAGSYSQDGQRIVLGRGKELWTARRNGSEARRIAVTEGLIYFARWSPDGSRIRFSTAVSEPSGLYALKEVDSDGQHLRTLALSPETDAHSAKRTAASSRWGGVWSDAAQGFVYEVTRHGATDLWRMRNKGWFTSLPPIEQLTAGPLDFGSPAAIPGRRDLVVTGTRRQGILQRYDSGRGRFVPYLNGISAEMVDFSRDGKWVTYITFPDLQLWRSRVDGTQALQLTQPPMRAGVPRISPDMKQIAFSGQRQEEGWHVYLIPFGGGTPRLAMSSGSHGEVSPSWSPDGTRLLFRADNSGDWLYNNELRIFNFSSRSISTIPDSKLRFNQRFSPTGEWVAATPNDESELDLYDVARGQWSELVKMRADYPSWSADGRYIYYISNTEEHGSCIYRVQVATRTPEFVASLADTERAIDDSWGQWAGVTPDGSPLIIANDDLQQIYALSFGPG